jgi:menaquinone-dependent protoporphyrinogen oxidase
MTEVDDVGRYDAVVLGSAIHGGKWLLDGTKLVDRNAALLRERPVWLFSVSTLGDEESMFSPRVARRLCAMRKETPEVTIYVQPYVRASIEPSPERSLVRTGWRPDAPSSRAIGERNGDHRNWPAIEACAGSIAGQLLPAPSQGIAPLRR